jgi:hypothetical protein
MSISHYFFLPLPDFLPPLELLAPSSPFGGLELTNLYLLFLDEKAEPPLPFLFFLEIDALYALDLLPDLEPPEYTFGPFLDLPLKESLPEEPDPDFFVAETEPDFFFQNWP